MGGGGGGGGMGGDSGAGGGGGAGGDGAGDDDDKRDEYIDGGGRRQRKNKRQARGRRRGRPNEEDSGAEEEEDLRIKESELHSFWKSMLPYFAPIEEEDLKLLMPQPENDDSYWKIPRLGRYYREVWAEEDGETSAVAPAAAVPARPKPRPPMAAPQGAMPPSSSLAVGAAKTVRATGLGTALTKQKVANIRKRMQKRKGKRKANSDDDYVFSAEEMESEEDTGVGGDMESEIINDLAGGGDEGVDMGDLGGFAAEDVYNFTDDDDDFVAGKRPGKGKGKARARPLNGGGEAGGLGGGAKRKRDHFIAGGELLGGDIIGPSGSGSLGLDATGLEGDTSSRADDPTSMPSLTGDFTTRLLSALMEENIVFPPPYSTTAPYLPGGPEAGMNEGGGGLPGFGTEWSDAGGPEANGFGGGSSVYSDTEETQGEEKAKFGGKGVKGLAGKAGGAASKGPKAKQHQQAAMKAKSEASLKSLSGSFSAAGAGGLGAGTMSGTNTTAPVPLSASSSAITAKKTPWGTITDVPAIPVRQLPVDYSQANYLSLEDRLKLELRSIGLLSDAEVDPRTREDDELCAEIRFLRLKLKQQLAQNNQRKSHLYQKALAKMKEQKKKEQQDIIDKDIEKRYLRYLKTKKKQGKGKK